MARDANSYDLSNYPKYHFLYSEINNKVIGRFKDETAGVLIKEYVGLRPTMYSILLSNEESSKRAKGVKKHVLKKKNIHENYREVLDHGSTLHHPMNMIRNLGHRIYPTLVNKISLSAVDTKRYILPDRIHTLAYGHYKLLL